MVSLGAGKTIEPYIYKYHTKYYIKQNKKILAKADTPQEARQQKQKLIREGKLLQRKRGRPTKKHEDRYIRETPHHKYAIQKYVDKKMQHYGIYNTLEEARNERDYLESIDWNYDNIECIPREEKMKTKYKQHLYDYVELRRSSPNRKILKAWVDYLEEICISDGECYTMIDTFMSDDPITCNKKPSTIQRYEKEIRRFTEYVYQMEGWTLPVTEEENKKELHDKLAKHRLASDNKDSVDTIVDDEYKAFLERYEQLTKRQQ